MPNDKFSQPVEAIKFVHRTKGHRTLLTDDVMDEAKRRVAAGADLDEVANELAAKEVGLIYGGDEE